MATEYELIFETWLSKFKVQNSGKFSFRKPWKKLYYKLCRKDTTPLLLEYDVKPSSNSVRPREQYVLNSNYCVYKRGFLNGKNFVCEILLSNGLQLRLAAEDEPFYHLFVYFISVQTKLRNEYESECVKVRPDNSTDQEKIGARGNLCLLHVSKWGITLILELSKAVLAQWPLNCIRLYESTGRGTFMFETGSRSPMGAGKYSFNTRHLDDDYLYDSLDRAVGEALGLLQLVASRASGSSLDSLLETSHNQLVAMQSLVAVVSDAQFIAHHKKVARTIHDHLSEHLGSTRTSFSSSSPDNQSPSVEMSMTSLGSSPLSSSIMNQNNNLGFSSQRSVRGRVPIPLPIDSQYLHPFDANAESLAASNAGNNVIKPPMMKPLGKRIANNEQLPHIQEQYLDMRRPTITSKSCEDLTARSPGARNTYMDHTYFPLNEQMMLSPTTGNRINGAPSNHPGRNSSILRARSTDMLAVDSKNSTEKNDADRKLSIVSGRTRTSVDGAVDSSQFGLMPTHVAGISRTQQSKVFRKISTSNDNLSASIANISGVSPSDKQRKKSSADISSTLSGFHESEI